MDQESYEKCLLEISPKERAKLEREGLSINPSGGPRVNREELNKTEQEIQAARLEKLMNRFDVPLEDEGREWKEYRAARTIGPKLPGFQKEKSGNDYHKYRTINKKKVTRELLNEKTQKEINELTGDLARRDELKAKEEEITAKKRAKRQRKKEKGVSKK